MEAFQNVQVIFQPRKYSLVPLNDLSFIYSFQIVAIIISLSERMVVQRLACRAGFRWNSAFLIYVHLSSWEMAMHSSSKPLHIQLHRAAINTHCLKILILFKSRQKAYKFWTTIMVIIRSPHILILLILIKSWGVLTKDRSKCADCYRSLWIGPTIHRFLIHIKSISCAFFKLFVIRESSFWLQALWSGNNSLRFWFIWWHLGHITLFSVHSDISFGEDSLTAWSERDFVGGTYQRAGEWEYNGPKRSRTNAYV